MSGDEEKKDAPGEERTQTGLCGEAQADGVPCDETGRECETCGRGRAPDPAPPVRPERKRR